MPSFTLAAGLLALAASATSASSHYSHPRDLQLAAHGNRMMPRVLPRTGRRIVSRANEATLKCLTDYTFALCDGANCTDMGSVAAGTKCVDNAITWDTSSEASTQDSSAASAGLGSVPIPVAVPASISTPAAAPAAASSSDAATTVNKATGVQLNVNSNSDHRLSYWQKMAAENAGNSATQQTSADVQSVETPVATPTGAAATAVFSSASPAETTPAAAATTTTTEAVQLFASATTTSSAPAQTTSAAASSGPADNQVYDGKATYYYQYGVAGSCGVYNSDSTFIVALSYQIVDNGAHCGQKVHIKNTANGKEITATVADTCPGCDATHLDLSEGAFLALGDLSSGVLPIEWYFEGSAAARAR